MKESEQQGIPRDSDLPTSNGSHRIDTGGGTAVSGDAEAGRDFVGRDQIIYQGDQFIQSALSAVDEAQKAQTIEAELLAHGVKDYVQRLIAAATAESEGGPYRGLVAYRLRDADIFFGRSRAIAGLLEALQRRRLTVLQSESGAGKSSLLSAGIAPRMLAEGNLPVILRPYNLSPSLKIKQAFLPNVARTPDLAGAPLREFMHQVTSVLGNDTMLLLVLDQFEEFFTLLTDAEQRATFVGELAECMEDETLNVRWVLAMRSEFFGDLATFRPRIRNPFGNDFRLNRLTEHEARQVVVEPASHVGLAFEDALVERLLADLRQPDGEIDPPQVQLVCLALYNALRERAVDDADRPAVITSALYKEEGGARGILRNHLQRVLRRALPTEEERELARRLLMELVSADQRRLRRTRSDLARQIATGIVGVHALDDVLGELVENRLVNVEQADDDEEVVYELAHDYLLEEIQLDPEVQAQKAAQELLIQETEAYQRFDTLLSAQKYDIINSQRAHLAIDDIAAELLGQSENAIRQEERQREEARQRELQAARALASEEEARRKAEAARAEEAEARRRAEEERAEQALQLAREAEASERRQAESALKLRRLASGLGGALLVAIVAVTLAFVFYGKAKDGMEEAQKQQQLAETLIGEVGEAISRLGSEKLLDVLEELFRSNHARAAIRVLDGTPREQTPAVAADFFFPTMTGDRAIRIAAAVDRRAQELEMEGDSGNATTLRSTLANLIAIAIEARVTSPGTGSDKDGADALLTGLTYVHIRDRVGAEYVYVPQGPFLMGSDPENDSFATGDEQRQHEVHLDGFWIMRTEVTNAQYNRCVDERTCDRSNLERREPRFADQPVRGVNWRQARDYATWIGGRLPTEAEWEKACRGPDARIYPWGNNPPSSERLNYGEGRHNGVIEVGNYPTGASPYGLVDMAGNVREWTSSKYDRTLFAYPYDPDDGREDLEGDSQRTLRGGSYDYANAGDLRCAYRFWYGPNEGFDDFGFRVVWSPEREP